MTIVCPFCNNRKLMMPIDMAKRFEAGEEVVDGVTIHCPGANVYHSLVHVGNAPTFYGVQYPKIVMQE